MFHVLDKFTIGDGDRPDTIAEELYGDHHLIMWLY